MTMATLAPGGGLREEASAEKPARANASMTNTAIKDRGTDLIDHSRLQKSAVFNGKSSQVVAKDVPAPLALRLADHRAIENLGIVEDHSSPAGTFSLWHAYPPLKRRAIIGRPCGTELSASFTADNSNFQTRARHAN
jgi:hypothetical protein